MAKTGNCSWGKKQGAGVGQVGNERVLSKLLSPSFRFRPVQIFI